MLKITLNDNQAIQKLTGIASQLQHPRKLYGLLGETLKKIHADRFKAKLRPMVKNGNPFPLLHEK